MSSDPWTTTYTSNAKGVATVDLELADFSVTSSLGLPVAYRTFVVHDESSARIGCGIVGDPTASVASIGTYPGYAGANAASRGLGAKPSVGAKLGNWFRTQQEHGADLVAKIDFQDATVIAVIGAVMSYKERKMVALVTQAVGSFIKLYLLMLFVRVLLTWFPNVDWMRQPWAILRQVTDPYLNLFRNLIPPIMGQIDFTPILGFMVLQFLAKVLSSDPSVGRF